MEPLPKIRIDLFDRQWAHLIRLLSSTWTKIYLNRIKKQRLLVQGNSLIKFFFAKIWKVSLLVENFIQIMNIMWYSSNKNQISVIVCQWRNSFTCPFLKFWSKKSIFYNVCFEYSTQTTNILKIMNGNCVDWNKKRKKIKFKMKLNFLYQKKVQTVVAASQMKNCSIKNWENITYYSFLWYNNSEYSIKEWSLLFHFSHSNEIRTKNNSVFWIQIILPFYYPFDKYLCMIQMIKKNKKFFFVLLNRKFKSRRHTTNSERIPENTLMFVLTRNNIKLVYFHIALWIETDFQIESEG